MSVGHVIGSLSIEVLDVTAGSSTDLQTSHSHASFIEIYRTSGATSGNLTFNAPTSSQGRMMYVYLHNDSAGSGDGIQLVPQGGQSFGGTAPGNLDGDTERHQLVKLMGVSATQWAVLNTLSWT